MNGLYVLAALVLAIVVGVVIPYAKRRAAEQNEPGRRPFDQDQDADLDDYRRTW